MQSGTTMVEVTPIVCVLQISHQPKTASGPIISPLSATPPRFTTLMAVLAQSQQFVRRLELLLLAVSGHATQCQTAKQQMPWRGKKTEKGGCTQSPLFQAPFSGGEGSFWDFSLVDKVRLPANLEAGDYVLSWRWDCEVNKQIFINCADVKITAGPSPNINTTVV